MSVPKASKTARGFSMIEFGDLYGNDCSIQKSSLATADAIWLGLDEGQRMHLDRDTAAWLARVLSAFATTGELPDLDMHPP
jgi:hypothetical protein